MEAPLSGLRKIFNTMHPIPQEEWNEFVKIWLPFTAKRKEIITLTGEKEKYLYYVVEGVQRIYYYDEQNREATVVFTYKDSLGGVLDSMMLQTPSRYFYETLTPSTFFRASITDVFSFMSKSDTLDIIVRQGLAQALSGVMERLVELQCFTSEEKFRKLLQRSPHILQLVPHKYLANYLGIDPTNFSKLINKVKI